MAETEHRSVHRGRPRGDTRASCGEPPVRPTPRSANVSGERRWRNHVVVPDANLGQTCESLRVDMDAIVAALAQNAGPSRG